MLHTTRSTPARRPLRHRTIVVGLTAATALTLGACSQDSASDDSDGTGTAGGDLDVVVHSSFVLSDEAKAAFEEESGLTVNIVTAGDGGALANQLVLTKGSPLGDVAFGIDNSFATRAVAEGVFEPYTSPEQPSLSTELAVDDSGALTAVDYGDVCMNIDTAWFETAGVEAPATLEDLAEPEYADLTVVTNPATSSPGLAFLFATVGEFGEDGYLDYWQSLADNGLKIVEGWEDAYYVDFSASGEGDRPVVLSYASSPAATVSDDGSSTSTAALLDTCFRQVEYAGVLAGADNSDGAQQFIDFLLGEQFQSEIPTGMYVYPVNTDAEIPAEWAEFAPVPDAPIELDPAEISDNRDQWIQDWTATVIG